MSNKMIHDQLWTAVNKSVEQLSTTQAAIIGGVGSGASAVSVLSVDGATWLQSFTLICGAIGALLSIGLLILKFVQQRREMAKWREQNEIEHDVMLVQHAVSQEDRGELHRELEELREHCDRCGHLIGREKL